MKIERDVQGDKTTVRLIGDFRSNHIQELRKQVEHAHAEITLDLKEITTVDVDVVRFFVECVAKRTKIVHCPRYIKKWLLLETET